MALYFDKKFIKIAPKALKALMIRQYSITIHVIMSPWRLIRGFSHILSHHM